MTLHNARPVRFSPRGLSDTLDSTDTFPGACAILQNLIPDTSTKDIWTCRPASTQNTAFGSFTTPGFISVFKVIGNYVYGMIASGRNAGKDEPFSFNLTNNTFTTIANVLSSNVPASPATSGDWTPPTMDLIGTKLVVTHPGFSGLNYFGWIDITDPTKPRWHAGNLWATGAIITFSTLTGGSGYTTPGTYTNVTLTGGGGTGATADIVVAGGAVTSVTLDNPGSGYVAGNSLSAADGDIGGRSGGVAFTILVGTIQTTGSLTLTTIPTWVRQFYQRAWFGINPSVGQPSVIFTDVLGLGATNAGQVLTFGNNLPLVGAAPLGLSNQLGGIIQSLMIWQDDENVIQVTGDYASSNIAINSLNVSIGTIAPRSITETPLGIVFLAPDGFRLVDFDARISDPIGVAGSGVVIPFINAFAPTRINAACNGQVFRVSVQRADISGNPWQEFWYDLVRKIWSGPHTFPSDMIDAYGASFIIAPHGVSNTLFTSAIAPTASSVYTENGTALTWTFQSSMLPDNGEMARNEITEMRVMAAIPVSGGQFNVVIQDQNGSPINQVTRIGVPQTSTVWDTATWDAAASVWDGGGVSNLYPYRIDFPFPTVYTRAAIQINGMSAFGARLGDINIRNRPLPYLDDLLAP